jgi:hypothetical protein
MSLPGRAPHPHSPATARTDKGTAKCGTTFQARQSAWCATAYDEHTPGRTHTSRWHPPGAPPFSFCVGPCRSAPPCPTGGALRRRGQVRFALRDARATRLRRRFSNRTVLIERRVPPRQGDSPHETAALPLTSGALSGVNREGATDGSGRRRRLMTLRIISASFL